MKITSIELKGYKRLSLNNIHYIKLDFNSKIQFILGTNGSGKSSLLKELSPLPAIHTEFITDGYKLIVLENRNSTYILTSDFRKGKFYSFIKDSKELNPSGTITVYKELVRQEFNITQDIHNLMTGITVFHDMSVMERRNWFTKICDSDYTYAIKFYNRLKERHRDLVGGVKLSKVRLVQETNKLISEDTLASLKQDVKQLDVVLQELLSIKTTIPDKSSIVSALDRVYTEVKHSIDTLTDNRTIYMNNDVLLTEDGMRVQLLTEDSELVLLGREADTIYKDLIEQQELFKLLNGNDLEGVDDIDSNMDRISEEIAILNKQILLPIQLKDTSLIQDAIKAIDMVRPDLLQVCSNLLINHNYSINRNDYKSRCDALADTKDRYKQLDIKHSGDVKRKKEYDHLKEHNSIECPECKHSWITGYNAIKHKLLIDTIDNQSKQLKELETSIEILTNDVDVLHEYFNNVKSLKQLMSVWSVLMPYWEYVIEKEYLYISPITISDEIDTLREDLVVQGKIEKLTSELNELISLKTKLADELYLNISNVKSKMDELDTKLNSINKSMDDKRSKIAMYNRQLSVLSTMSDEVDKLYKYSNHIRRGEKKLKDIEVQEALNVFINSVNSTISSIETKISKIDSQKAVVDSIAVNLDTLEEEEKIVKLAVKALSPTEGLIAKGLKGFINHFVYRLNQFISTIWLYPLELVPIMDDGTDLDFKFNVKINNDHVINDVKLGSSAMKEIIDLAFRVVSAEYLGLGDAPLFLDEFGLKLDSAHRDSAYHAINELLNTSEFSQVFMISHYSSNYGGFKNSDITVLSSTNIEIPRDMSYNTNAVIE